MGFYISLNDSKGRMIAEKKYSLGTPMIMFETYRMENGSLIFEVDGKTAIVNLNSAISRVKNVLDKEYNDFAVNILYSLESVRNYIREDETYSANLSEAMMLVENKDFDPMFFIWEAQWTLDDLENGYNKRVKDCSNATKMLNLFFSNLPHINGSYIEKNNNNYIVVNVHYELSVDEKEELSKIFFKKNDEHQQSQYVGRKIHEMVSPIFPNAEVMHRKDCEFYVVFAKSDVEQWANNKPYVKASYRIPSTYDINYLVRNTPEEKEKFYCYVSFKGNAVSIIIDGVEYINLSDDEISANLGKALDRYAYEGNEIDMKYVG